MTGAAQGCDSRQRGRDTVYSVAHTTRLCRRQLPRQSLSATRTVAVVRRQGGRGDDREVEESQVE